MKRVALWVIRAYQKTLSLDHGLLARVFPGGTCRFTPTCSQYTYQAIEKYGFWQGGVRGAKRICRCHPFSEGGFDPP